MDDEGYIPLIDFIPINVSDGFAKHREMCKKEQDRRIWDAAIKECIKSVILETMPIEQIEDLKWLLFDDWDWTQDKEFIEEIERKKQKAGEQW